jgi:hypothetical protein
MPSKGCASRYVDAGASASDAPATHDTIVVMRTTISLPEPLLENAKQYAAIRQVTLSVILEDALRCFLAKPAAQKPDRFRLHTVAGRLVDPNIDLDRTSALIAEDDEAAFRRK